MNKIYVNCGGRLVTYDSKKEVMDFFEECIMMCEGSERERYSNIYFSVKSNLNTDKRCFTDGTSHVYTSKIDPDSIDYYEESLLRTSYGIDKVDLLMYKANNCLAQEHSRIYQTTVERYKDSEDLYNDYLADKKENTFYILDRDTITCFDTSANPPDNYWVEDFSLKDYEYANKWLKGEIEYEDYLEATKESDMEM